MSKGKFILLCVVTYIISATLPLSAFAHSGGTDAHGGHWNHSTGEYHYHSGKYAGMTVKPGEPFPHDTSELAPITDNLSKEESDPEETIETKPKEDTIEEKMDKLFIDEDEEIATVNTPDASAKTDHTYWIIALIVGIIILGVTLIGKLKKSPKRSPSTPKYDVSMIPSGIELDEDLLPYVVNRKYGYGKRFNVFVSDGGDCYHMSKCPSIKTGRRNVIHRYEALGKYKPCANCKPKTYVDSWYIEFLEKNSLEDKYELERFLKK